jgi:hypothetical protein
MSIGYAPGSFYTMSSLGAPNIFIKRINSKDHEESAADCVFNDS